MNQCTTVLIEKDDLLTQVVGTKNIFLFFFIQKQQLFSSILGNAALQ